MCAGAEENARFPPGCGTAGNRLTLDDGQNPVISYTYDDADQLTQVSNEPAYYYDLNGNWRSIGAGTAATWWAIYDYDNRPVRSGPCHDVDADGHVTAADVTIVDQHRAGEGEALYDYHYDINQDGVIDAADVIACCPRTLSPDRVSCGGTWSGPSSGSTSFSWPLRCHARGAMSPSLACVSVVCSLPSESADA